MAQQNKVQLLDVPYTDDWNAYSFNMSINNALTSLQNQIDALNTRVDKEGVITGKMDNAWYVKLPDGVLIQGVQNLLPSGSAGINVVWPIEFIDTNYIAVSDITGNAAGNVISSWVWSKDKPSAHVGARELGGGNPTSNYIVMCIAIGRWK
ncbi:MAG: hypothetical protein DBY43_04450 [Clostridiaceae bacterium]|nr:MAG: hypothetical protein DBY43_03760 [Clostridiaceae bacterium]PWL42039.1 MAG: hypothetical protein DBY43_04105 [Clostridiaceae bacterium]PWL42107.1 MAG: hypothetical protein DBY43_04450 [Clostridiaceae bacterium]